MNLQDQFHCGTHPIIILLQIFSPTKVFVILMTGVTVIGNFMFPVNGELRMYSLEQEGWFNKHEQEDSTNYAISGYWNWLLHPRTHSCKRRILFGSGDIC